MDMRKWFKEAQYGMMVHWGLYSLLAGEYKDRYSRSLRRVDPGTSLQFPMQSMENLHRLLTQCSLTQKSG